MASLRRRSTGSPSAARARAEPEGELAVAQRRGGDAGREVRQRARAPAPPLLPAPQRGTRRRRPAFAVGTQMRGSADPCPPARARSPAPAPRRARSGCRGGAPRRTTRGRRSPAACAGRHGRTWRRRPRAATRRGARARLRPGRRGSCRGAARAFPAPAPAARRAAGHLDAPDGEERGLARSEIRAEGDCEQPEAEGERTARRQEPRPRTGGSRRTRGGDRRCAGARRPWTLGGHPATFAAGGDAPTGPRAAAARAGRGTRPRAELDAVLLVRAPAGLGHERERVGVRAPPAFSMKFACFGEICAPPMQIPLQPARFEHPPRAQLVLGVLEDAAERALVRRLGRLALRVQLAHRRP